MFPMVPAAGGGGQATAETRRWWRSRIVVALLSLLPVAACTSQQSQDEPPSALDDLAAPRDGFRFVYRARGTGVLDCVLPNRQLEGTVFPDGTVLVTTETPAGQGTAIMKPDTVYLSADLFSAPPDGPRWLRIDQEDVERLRPRLARILGADLTSYVAASGPPPDGNATVAATLEEDDPEPIDPIRTPDGALAQGFRFVVDSDDAVPVVDAWIGDDGNIARVQVRDSVAGSPGEPAPDTGWVLDYLALPAGTVSPDAPADAARVTDEALGALAPPVDDGCELEIGREPADTAL